MASGSPLDSANQFRGGRYDDESRNAFEGMSMDDAFDEAVMASLAGLGI
mgnify:CR=1 FL=1